MHRYFDQNRLNPVRIGYGPGWKWFHHDRVTFRVIQLIFWIALSAIQFQLPTSIQAAEYSINGSYSAHWHGASPNIVRRAESGTFNLSVRDCDWWISVISGAKPGRLEVGTSPEGDILVLYRLSPGGGVSFAPEINKEIGQIEPLINPVGLTHPEIVTIWWAYASGCHLRTNGLNQSRPLLLPEAEHYALYYQRHFVRTQIELLNGSPGLPARSVFFDDGIRRYWSSPQDALLGLPFKQSKRNGSFRSGFTNVVIEVGSTTNLNGSVYPLAVTLQEFKPPPGIGFNQKLRLTKTIRLFASNFWTKANIENFAPVISNKIAFTDNRFALDDPPIRGINFPPGEYGRQWMSRDQVRTSEAIKDAKSDALLKLQIVQGDFLKRNGTRLFRFFVLCVAVAFVLLLWVWLEKSSKRKRMGRT